MEIDLWDFQSRSVDGLRDNFRAKVPNQLLVSGTGSGKTRIATYLLNETNRNRKNALFVVDRLALVHQTSTALAQFSIPHGITQGQNRVRPWERTQVATVQTLANRYWQNDFWDLIVVDEAHTANQWLWGVLKQRAHRVVGLTATPQARALGTVYEASVSVTTTNHLIQNGPGPGRTYLSPYIVFSPSQPDMTGAKVDRHGEWTKDEAATRSLPIVGDCVVEYVKHALGKKFICFGASIAHCEELAKQFMQAGINVALYTSRTPDDECVRVVEEFRKPDSYIRGLISVAKLAKGFDVPDVECGIFARPLRRSLTEWIQMFGRILRYNPGKTAIMLDHSGNYERFEAEMAEFFETGEFELDDGTKKSKPPKKPRERTSKKCPRCSRIHQAAPHCPSCGFEYQRRSEIIHLPGELKEFARATDRQVKEDWYAQLLYIQTKRGRPGLADVLFLKKFGHLPKGLYPLPKRAGRDAERWEQHCAIQRAKGQRYRPRRAA